MAVYIIVQENLHGDQAPFEEYRKQVIGNSARLDFTAIGPAVNLASRIQDLCRGLNRPLLASKAFASPCGSMLVPLGKFDLAGFPEPQEIYGLPE